MEKYVLDTFAVFVFLNHEKGYKTVETLLQNKGKKEQEVYLSLLSFGEIYYILIREIGIDEATRIITKIESLDVKIIPVDSTLTKEAAKIKAKGGLSYADSFVIAAAIKLKGTVVTGDGEFKKFSRTVAIKWI